MLLQEIDSGYTCLGAFLGLLFPILLYTLVVRPLYFAPLSHVPGPAFCKLSWYFIACYDVMLQRNEKVVEWHEKYGPVVCIRPGEVSISDSSAMRDIYGAAGKHAKSGYFDHFIAYGEQAIFAIRPYRDHSQKRKLTSSFYQATSIYKLIVEDFVRERVHALIKQFDNMLTTSSSIDIYPIFNRYAFDNISRLAYGPRHCSYTIENDCPERRILSGLKRSQVWGPLQLNFPLLYKPTAALMTFLKNQKDFLTAEDDLTEWNTKTLSAATADAKISEDHSVLRRLTEVKDTNGLPLSHNFIASELLDNLNAAQETVTVALTYLIYHLSRNPDWQARVRAELLALPVQPDSYPSFASIDAAPIFHACLNEVYRLNPGSSGRAERIVPAGGREYAKTYLPGGVRSPPPFFHPPSSHRPPSSAIIPLSQALFTLPATHLTPSTPSQAYIPCQTNPIPPLHPTRPSSPPPPSLSTKTPPSSPTPRSSSPPAGSTPPRSNSALWKRPSSPSATVRVSASAKPSPPSKSSSWPRLCI